MTTTHDIETLFQTLLCNEEVGPALKQFICIFAGLQDDESANDVLQRVSTDATGRSNSNGSNAPTGGSTRGNQSGNSSTNPGSGGNNPPGGSDAMPYEMPVFNCPEVLRTDDLPHVYTEAASHIVSCNNFASSIATRCAFRWGAWSIRLWLKRRIWVCLIEKSTLLPLHRLMSNYYQDKFSFYIKPDNILKWDYQS